MAPLRELRRVRRVVGDQDVVEDGPSLDLPQLEADVAQVVEFVCYKNTPSV